MQRLVFSSLLIALLFAGTTQLASSHCEVPCGVYDDGARFTRMFEDTTTIRKAMQNIQALAANQQITETDDGQPIISTVVTVLVTPEEAEKLALAANQGRIQMTLRNSLDLDVVETAGERESRLFITSNSRPTPSRARVGTTTRPAAASIIEVYKGGQRSLVNYR